MTFMSSLRADLESKYPDYAMSTLYFGYMDMTYFAFTPPQLRQKKLKIAIVYLHEENRFEVWLAGNNRQIQAEYNALLSQRELGKYALSQINPGVDAIIAYSIIEKPDFDDPDSLKAQIETGTMEFIHDITAMLS